MLPHMAFPSFASFVLCSRSARRYAAATLSAAPPPTPFLRFIPTTDGRLQICHILCPSCLSLDCSPATGAVGVHSVTASARPLGVTSTVTCKCNMWQHGYVVMLCSKPLLSMHLLAASGAAAAVAFAADLHRACLGH